MTARPLFNSEPKIRDLVFIFLCVKASFLILVFLNQHLLPFDWRLYIPNLVHEIQGLPDFMRAFNTWDTQHYLLLAEMGYGTNPMSNAFYPLYPWLIGLTAPLFAHSSLIAALVIANLASLLVPVYLYRLVRLSSSADHAFRATILLLAFPTAFYLSLAYAEALFLALTLMAFFYLFTKDVPKASLCCLLLPLARAQGLLMLVPILGMALASMASAQGSRLEKMKIGAETYLLPALAGCAGVFLYLLVMKLQTNDFLTGFEAQRLFVAQNSIGDLFRPYDWFMRNFIDIRFSVHGFTDTLSDRLLFVIFLPTLIGIFLTQRKSLFFYAALMLLIPALAGSFMSYARYLLVVFPIPIFLARNPDHFIPLTIVMFAVQILFFLGHTGGYWIA